MRPRVMIVEDDESVRHLYSHILKNSGYDVIEAVDGQEALTKYLEQPCDMVITDMNMPVMNGMDLIEELRRHSPDVSIIMITAYGTSHTHREALKRGSDDYIPKPFEIEDFQARVRGLFDKRQAGNQPQENDPRNDTQE